MPVALFAQGSVALVHVLGEHDANMLFDICVGHLYDNSKQASKISPCHGREKFFDEMTGKTLPVLYPSHHGETHDGCNSESVVRQASAAHINSRVHATHYLGPKKQWGLASTGADLHGRIFLFNLRRSL